MLVTLSVLYIGEMNREVIIKKDKERMAFVQSGLRVQTPNLNFLVRINFGCFEIELWGRFFGDSYLFLDANFREER